MDDEIRVNADEYNVTVDIRSAGCDLDELSAMLKWDGCVDLHGAVQLFGNEERDYIHICDLDKFIARLVKLREIAVERMGKRHGEWDLGPLYLVSDGEP